MVRAILAGLAGAAKCPMFPAGERCDLMLEVVTGEFFLPFTDARSETVNFTPLSLLLAHCYTVYGEF